MVIKTKKGSMAGRGIDALFTAPANPHENEHNVSLPEMIQTAVEPLKLPDTQPVEYSDVQTAKFSEDTDLNLPSASNSTTDASTVIATQGQDTNESAAKLSGTQPSGLQSVSTAKRLDAKILEKDNNNEGRIKRTLYLTKDQNRMLLELYHIYQIEGKKLEFSELVGKGIEMLYEKHK